MKRIISGLLAAAGIAAFAVSTGADEAVMSENPSIRFETVALDVTTDTVSVGVYIENNPGFVSATIPVMWNDEVLKLTDIQDYHTTVTSGWAGHAEYSEITDTYYLAWNNDTLHNGSYGEQNFTADGKLCTMVFELLDTAQTDVLYTISANLDDPLANMMNWNMEDFLNQKEDDDIYGITVEFIEGGIKIEPQTEEVLGDINGDGVADTLDRMQLARYLAKWKGYETINTTDADINSDGMVDTLDRMILARYIAHWPGYETLEQHRQ